MSNNIFEKSVEVTSGGHATVSAVGAGSPGAVEQFSGIPAPLRVLRLLERTGGSSRQNIQSTLNLTDEAYQKLRLDLPGLGLVETRVGGGLRLTRRGKRCLKDLRSPRLKASSGTGFFVAPYHVLTNWHVVEDAARVQVTLNGDEPVAARIAAADERNDLALLETGKRARTTPIFRKNVRVGEEIAVFGFPFTPSGTFTVGNVNALSTEHSENLLHVQAPATFGNSGSPVLDEAGSVVGVLQGGHRKVANVNYAVKAQVILDFLHANGLHPHTSTRLKARRWPAVADYAKSICCLVECNVPNGPVYEQPPAKHSGLLGWFGSLWT